MTAEAMTENTAGQCAVATAFPDATSAAIRILRDGGNAVDAAVAAAWTLSVCEPSASGIGGQSTLLIRHPDGACRVIDGHSYAPAAVSTNTVSSAQQRRGHRAAIVPSTPATLAYAQSHYGRLSLSETLQPAIATATEGYPITALQARQINTVAAALRENEAAAKTFLPDGRPLSEQTLLRQPALARTLSDFARNGVDDFYRGRMARLIARDMQTHGGLMTQLDLRLCTVPVDVPPLLTTYRGRTVITAAHPAGGPHLYFALDKLGQRLADCNTDDDDEWYEAIALATYDAFRQRAAGAWSNGISIPPLTTDETPGDTTHLTVADASGCVVALTQSIQSVFGAKVLQPDLGFFYNNYLWTCPRDNHPDALGPRCRPCSNVAPTIVVQPSGGQPLLALGSAGSRRIISSILQVISNVVDRGKTIGDAVAAPRIHARLSRNVWLESSAATPGLAARLQRNFGRVDLRKDYDFKLGSVQALHWTAGGWSAAADPRRDGKAETIWL